MRIALDTNAYSDAAKGAPHAAAILRSADEICVPFIVLAELRAGFALGTRGKKNEAALISFLNSPRVRPLWADEQTTHHYASVFAGLKKLGNPIPTNDLWIAALVIQHDLVLFSSDAHFNLIVQIPRI